MSHEGIVRHFTATGFVVHDGRVALHWHPKVKAWLPPGGHIEANEDPVEAVLREVLEETGTEVEVVPTSPELDLDYPEQVLPPYTIMVEDIHDPEDGFHKHIDMIYFCRPLSATPELSDGWRWVSKDDLACLCPLTEGTLPPEAPPEDVRLLGIHAIEHVSSRSGQELGGLSRG